MFPWRQKQVWRNTEGNLPMVHWDNSPTSLSELLINWLRVSSLRETTSNRITHQPENGPIRKQQKQPTSGNHLLHLDPVFIVAMTTPCRATASQCVCVLKPAVTHINLCVCVCVWWEGGRADLPCAASCWSEVIYKVKQQQLVSLWSQSSLIKKLLTIVFIKIFLVTEQVFYLTFDLQK